MSGGKRQGGGAPGAAALGAGPRPLPIPPAQRGAGARGRRGPKSNRLLGAAGGWPGLARRPRRRAGRGGGAAHHGCSQLEGSVTSATGAAGGWAAGRGGRGSTAVGDQGQGRQFACFCHFGRGQQGQQGAPCRGSPSFPALPSPLGQTQITLGSRPACPVSARSAAPWPSSPAPLWAAPIYSCHASELCSAACSPQAHRTLPTAAAATAACWHHRLPPPMPPKSGRQRRPRTLGLLGVELLGSSDDEDYRPPGGAHAPPPPQRRRRRQQEAAEEDVPLAQRRRQLAASRSPPGGAAKAAAAGAAAGGAAAAAGAPAGPAIHLPEEVLCLILRHACAPAAGGAIPTAAAGALVMWRACPGRATVPRARCRAVQRRLCVLALPRVHALRCFALHCGMHCHHPRPSPLSLLDPLQPCSHVRLASLARRGGGLPRHFFAHQPGPWPPLPPLGWCPGARRSPLALPAQPQPGGGGWRGGCRPAGVGWAGASVGGGSGGQRLLAAHTGTGR